MHIIAIIDILIAISSIIIGSFVFIRNPKKSINQIFYFLMFTTAIWCFIEAQSIFSPDLNSFLFWDNFDLIWMLAITILLHFALTYTNSPLLINNKYPLFLMYGFAFFSMFIHLFFVIETNAILINGIWYSDFSGISETLNNIFLGVFSFIALISLIICIKYYFNIKDKKLKRKTFFIILGLAVPIIGGIIVDVLIGIPVSEEMIPLTTNHFITGTIIFFSYAIWRFDVFSLDLDTAAENIVAMMSDALFLVDNNKNIIMINNTAETITGYYEKDLIGKSINVLLEKKDSNHILSKENVNDVDASLKTKQDEIIPVSISSSIVTDEGDDIKGFIIICRDITERKQYEQSLMKEKMFSESLLNSLPGVFYFFDSKGHFLRWNKNFEIATEYSYDELKHLSLIDLFDHDEKLKVSQRINKVFEEGESYVEAHFLSKTGMKTPYYFTGVRMTVDDQPFCVGVGIDMSELKQVQQELQRAHDRLAALNKELEAKVEERTSEIQRLLNQKNEFINQLGHDLKTPLGPLVSLLPILKQKNDDKENKQMVDVLIRSVQKIKNLVNKTLNLAQLNSSSISLNLENIELGDEIPWIIDNISYSLDEKNITVLNKIPNDLNLRVDKVWFDELLSNLLSNSVKYSNNGGKIILDARIKDNEVLFSIQDDGIGITPNQLKHLFYEFYKADESRHDLNSSGLGLSISKKIVEKHGGRIWAESEGLGRGSTFYFTLPRSRSEQ